MAQKPITALIRGVRQYNHNCSLINALEKQNAQTKFQGFKVSKWGAGSSGLLVAVRFRGSTTYLAAAAHLDSRFWTLESRVQALESEVAHVNK